MCHDASLPTKSKASLRSNVLISFIAHFFLDPNIANTALSVEAISTLVMLLKARLTF